MRDTSVGTARTEAGPPGDAPRPPPAAAMSFSPARSARTTLKAEAGEAFAGREADTAGATGNDGSASGFDGGMMRHA